GVVDLVALDRIEQPLVDVDPHRAVLLAEVVGQIGPGHQVEPGELHVRILRNPPAGGFIITVQVVPPVRHDRQPTQSPIDGGDVRRAGPGLSSPPSTRGEPPQCPPIRNSRPSSMAPPATPAGWWPSIC